MRFAPLTRKPRKWFRRHAQTFADAAACHPSSVVCWSDAAIDPKRRQLSQSTIPPAMIASTRKTRNMATAIKNSILAIPAVAAETPEKPKKPATREIKKKIKAHFNISTPVVVGVIPEKIGHHSNIGQKATTCGESLAEIAGSKDAIPAVMTEPISRDGVRRARTKRAR